MKAFSPLVLAFVVSPIASSAVTAQSAACDTSLAIELPSQCDELPVSHPIEGLENFRQLTTPDGGIKPGILFRSDQLYDLSEAAVAELNALGLETIVDLRSHDELETHPNSRIDSVDFDVNLPIGSDPADIEKIMPLEVAEQIRPMWFDGKFEEINQLLEDHGVDLRQTRIDRYQDFATKFDPQVSRFLHLLTDSNNFPLLFHCAGGKDRTGFMAAVTLLTLGYSKEDVMPDYLATNVYTFGELEKLVGQGPQSLRPAFGAHPEQIEASLQIITDKYGSFEFYRRDILGISDHEVDAIKQNLLIQN
ncbi:tyrosine-protein phosphatase [Ruegeria sp. Ofav3-42]|uniref:tyrosine-protein phosphatase n=1 Tax=Ruegeria sp. Ofav3-42 TaxID=2917759 RepID=UPI001EF415BB|nr:tyrosine-protein phosphatase [Ruegeria sp. Ofav3-42]MCG7521845.1 tyrosine-protein phosphatase [Ruegeria sp. Ofav3-42]